MTLAEMAKLIGQHGLLRTDGLEVGVEILDVKQAYGRTRYVVKPLVGAGSTTVEDFRVTLGGF